MQEKIDYEQLYYDARYEIKILQQKIEELESDLKFINKSARKKINIKNEIIKEILKKVKNESKK